MKIKISKKSLELVNALNRAQDVDDAREALEALIKHVADLERDLKITRQELRIRRALAK